MHTMPDLLRRIERLEAERAIAGTVNRYAHAIDYGLDLEWVDCFTEQGVFEVRPRRAPSFRVCGQDELAAFIVTHSKAPSRWHKHLVTQHRIEVDTCGRSAHAESYILRVDEDDDAQPKIWVFGRYLDDLSLSADGVWRFVHRIIELEGAQPAAWTLLQSTD